MTTSEREKIRGKAKAYSDFIRQQHALPKAQRDVKKLADAKKRNCTLMKWLDE